MRNWAGKITLGCTILAFGIPPAGGSGCTLDDAVTDGVEGGVGDAVAGSISAGALKLLGRG